MSSNQRGFGLLEVTLALAIGLMILAAASQLFASAHQSWRLQGAALRMQNDARLALLRMAQDVRMAGMFGCLRPKPGEFEAEAARKAFANPLQIEAGRLNLVVAELTGYAGKPDWILWTDCFSDARICNGKDDACVAHSDQALNYGISRHAYFLQGTELKFSRNANTQPLIENVREFRLELAGNRLDITLRLFDPGLNIEQHHALSVALRNPVTQP
ncbi:PilW family protein [Pseudomonas sp. PSKL.D1]|uniref:PilW family protein n=1 Tax=Pseudomonas sp. PSKL.D1 TaxID=3029060 RepID=UPI0023819353|nr:prepilin-type N-terminal cleavage/methylation domain-containing protein [Pseudomonas sp. PSKL.D1]WDY57387.1 prepilin-type N-terminal cleavage/methylation domain-containing protein [Pseudomonas sp. PSKL.D1]